MKNKKKFLLLGVMLVNLMPYLKDGKVEWKATQVEAQCYTIEYYPTTSGTEYLCGDYSIFWNIFPWFEPCETLNSPPSDANIDGPCSPESSIHWSIGRPVDITDYDKLNWCVFAVLNALDGKDLCTYAAKYYYGTWQYPNSTNFCDIDVAVDNDCVVSLYNSYGLTVSDEVSLTALGNVDKSKQLLKLIDTNNNSQNTWKHPIRLDAFVNQSQMMKFIK